MTDLLFNKAQAYRQLFNDTRSDNFTTAFGVQKNEKPLLLLASNNFTVLVTRDYIEAQHIVDNMVSLGKKYSYLPHLPDTLMFTKQSNMAHRNSLLYKAYSGELDGLIVSPESLMQLLPPTSYLIDNTINLTGGMTLDPKQLTSKLVAIGYIRCDSLESSGQFALRGDIVEIMVDNDRYRIDYWDDTIESIVTITADREHSSKVEKLTIVPITTTQGVGGEVVPQLEKVTKSAKLSSNARVRLDTIIDSIKMQCETGKCYDYWLACATESATLADYLPQNSVVVWDEPKLIGEKIKFLYGEQDSRLSNLLVAGEVIALHQLSVVDRLNVYSNFRGKAQMAVQAISYGGTFFKSNSISKFATSAVINYSNQHSQLVSDITRYVEDGYQVVLTVNDDQSRTMLASQLLSDGIDVSLASPFGSVAIIICKLESGFISHTNKLVVVAHSQLFKAQRKQISATSSRTAFLSVDKGDYVVHNQHGIGLYEGLQRITTSEGDTKDYFAVLYKNGDRLLVPAENSDVLTRYTGGAKPHLSKLGGADFDKVKSQVRQSVKKLTIDLARLYAERQKPRGFVYTIDNELMGDVAVDFGHTETPDQLTSIDEVLTDLATDKIMDRVLVGDVGFGKTEVALRAIFAVVSNGYQCAVLAPTTILSQQHFEQFRARLSKYGIRVECVNRFKSAREISSILEDTLLGKVNVLVGTHRLLSRDVRFHNLSMLVLDEEQRFGVEHKEKIKSIKNGVDVLTLSATPIPRTLHMALSGIRDISTITTPPPIRQAVDTYAVEHNDTLMVDILQRELSRGGQAFVVYNRVETIDIFADHLMDLMPDARINVAHGKMAPTVLEDAVIAFKEKRTDILVCSTIVENGIDIPSANTMIVCEADRLGLSQLYQLKGRVGRGDKLAYAYFMYNAGKVLSDVAYKRLSSITQYSQLGSGFKIALKDLEMRGAGNILGAEQHGHMVKVGYDMYSQLLAEAVAEATGGKVEHYVDTVMEADIEGYAPDDYIVSIDERVNVYQQIASVRNAKQLEKITNQLVDVYGVMPESMLNLLRIADLKVVASQIGIVSVTIKHNLATITFATREQMFSQSVLELVSGDSYCSFASKSYSILVNCSHLGQFDRVQKYLKQVLLSIAR